MTSYYFFAFLINVLYQFHVQNIIADDVNLTLILLFTDSSFVIIERKGIKNFFSLSNLAYFNCSMKYCLLTYRSFYVNRSDASYNSGGVCRSFQELHNLLRICTTLTPSFPLHVGVDTSASVKTDI